MTRASQKTKPGRVSRSLARPGDPLVLADGRIIKPESDRAADVHKVRPQDFRPTKRRTLKDLPAPPNAMSGIACVFVYTILGISDGDIAEALNIQIDQVRKARKHSAYSELFECASGEFINADSDMMTARLAAYSHNALTGIVEIGMNGKKEANKLRANMDVMNRAGYTPKEQGSKSAMLKQELRIVVIDGESEVDLSQTMEF